MVISRGGVKTSVGGSYRGIGVVLLLRLPSVLADTVNKPSLSPAADKVDMAIGGIKSASGLCAWGD